MCKGLLCIIILLQFVKPHAAAKKFSGIDHRASVTAPTRASRTTNRSATPPTTFELNNTWFDLNVIFGNDSSTKLLFSFVKGHSSNIYSVQLDLTNGSLLLPSPLLIGQARLASYGGL